MRTLRPISCSRKTLTTKMPPYQGQFLLKASTTRVARLKTFTLFESWLSACDCQRPPQAQAPSPLSERIFPIPGFKGTKFQKCDCVWPIMILERFIFNKVNIGSCSLLATSRRLISGNSPVDTWRLKSSYGWFLPVQTRSNENVNVALNNEWTEHNYWFSNVMRFI